MVGFVVVSHSKELAEAAIHLANEMKKYNFPLINGSGTDGDFLGSNPLIIKEAILKAIDFLKDEGVDVENIKIADAPLVEGLIAGVAVNDEKADIESVLDELKELKTFSKLTY